MLQKIVPKDRDMPKHHNGEIRIIGLPITPLIFGELFFVLCGTDP